MQIRQRNGRVRPTFTGFGQSVRERGQYQQATQRTTQNECKFFLLLISNYFCLAPLRCNRYKLMNDVSNLMVENFRTTSR